MLGNRHILTPNEGTLQSMFGDTQPISYYAETEYGEKISNVSSMEEKIVAICDYAKELHHAQSEYNLISPYGGEDITVQMEDEIALNEVLTMFSGNELSEACTLLRNELSARNIELIHTKNIVETYQELQKLPQKLEKQYADYQLAKEDFAKKVKEKVLEISKHGESEYAKYEQQYNEIQSSPFRRFLSKIPLTRTYKELEAIIDSMSCASSDIFISEQTVIDGFFAEDEKPIYSAPHYWTPVGSDYADMKVITTDADLNTAIKEIREQLLNPDNQKAYKDCLFFYNIPVSSAPQTEQNHAVPDSPQKNIAKKSKHKETVLLR